jgi:Transposase DDE domain
MDLLAFEHDRCFVLEALRRGEIDYLEHVGEAMEGDFFRQLINRQVLQRLADSYPTPRKKEEVPVWLHLASEFSLKLHGAQSHHAFPRILRVGGLIDALGPQLGGCKTTHPETGDVTLACPGFNCKNVYDRQTPCDQDFLRKFARDTQEQRLHAWFNREVPRCLRSLKLLDPEGLLLGDASYLFVPNNPRYEGSDLLWFDEHNHPVDGQQIDRSDPRYQLRRCYKLVSLVHLRRELDLFFVVGARVISGRRHECPILYELVEGLVHAVGRDVMKILIVDRGLLDGPSMGRLKKDCHIDTIVPVRSNMNLHADVIGLTRSRDFRWEPYVSSATPPLSQTTHQPLRIQKREGKRQQTLAERQAKAAVHQTAPLGIPHTLLGIERDLQSWSDCPIPLTAVVSREVNEQGEYKDWVIVSTSSSLTATQIRSTYELRTAIEERHRQYKCFWDLTHMYSRAFSLVVHQALFVLLAYTMLQAHLQLRKRQELNRRTCTSVFGLLAPTLQVVAVYYRQRFCLFSLAEFASILLTIADPARHTLLEKINRIEKNLYSLLANARSP